MTARRLRREATAFAERMTALLNRTVTSGAEVTVFMHEGKPVATVAPGNAPSPLEARVVPLSTSSDPEERNGARLWLRVSFNVSLDHEGEHLMVLTSSFGLCIDPRSGRCPLRVEYDREKSRKAPAHVHISGESGGLAYAFGAVGRDPKSLHELHFPVGGRRFRPTLEDFIEFLHAERLIEVKKNWRQAIAEARSDWEQRQVRAAVRRYPMDAAKQLRDMGYAVRKTR